MALTREEIEQRATERAEAEGLKTWKLTGQGQYLVASRKMQPGSFHLITLDSTETRVVGCSNCPGFWRYRTCIHAAAVERRLAREGAPQRAAKRDELRRIGESEVRPISTSRDDFMRPER